MADHSKIEWTDATWNPLRGCSRVSEGCRNCYAERVAARFSSPGNTYEGLIHPGSRGWNGKVTLVPEKLREPWDWAKPKRIFVNSMSDMFHESVPFEFIAAVFWIMSATTRHTYQVLTKRPARMLEFFQWVKDYDEGFFEGDRISDVGGEQPGVVDLEWEPANGRRGGYDNCGPAFPFENVWLGVSVEDQKTANERIPLLLRCPAAVRWLSCEPLLGPIDLLATPAGDIMCRCDGCMNMTRDTRIDWVVAGGESGPHARPMHPDWSRSLRDQCASSGVPFFFKQWGEWIGGEFDKHKGKMVCQSAAPGEACGQIFWTNSGKPKVHLFEERNHYWTNAAARVGKRATGRLLDGVEHNAFPEQHA